VDKNSQEEIKKAAALKYDIEKDEAPTVIASGKGEIARKIIETAEKYNIPIKENQDIIDVLIRLNIGEKIPPELYQAVAEILSFIYRLE
jgi:flagellar biosynthesis protein